MSIDEKEFFHQATIRICGSLEIDQALMRCFQYLKKFIPMDEMRLNWFDHDHGTMHSIASADASGGKKLDMILPLPRVVTDEMEKHAPPTEVKIINRPEHDPVAFKLDRFLGFPNSSILILPLLLDGVRIGDLGIRVSGHDRYTEPHARLLSMLHDPFAVAMSNILRHEEVIRLKDLLADDNRYLTRELRHLAGDEIVGAEFGLKNVMELVRQVAPRDNPVLLLGETGVGKEVVANAIHYSSSRKDGPFIKVNCGAIPEGLLDSELFGHEKGAFTGAMAQKRGRFERSHTGTIFLDEVGELPLQAQVRLLRVIQHKEIERVGGTKSIPVDIRIITATHQNLVQMVEDNEFREDLWFRLNVFPIIIPPLRQRKSDIPALVGHFLNRKSRELNYHEIPPLAPGAIDRLMDHKWKGNVRELENMVERALIQYSGGPLNFDHFIFSQTDDMPVASVISNRILKLDEVDARHIEFVLETTHGKINGSGGAAELLGIHPNTLRHRMDKLGVRYGRRK